MTSQNFIIFLCCVDIDQAKKDSKVETSDGHIFITKKDNKILWHNSLPLLSHINIARLIHYSSTNVVEGTFNQRLMENLNIVF